MSMTIYSKNKNDPYGPNFSNTNYELVIYTIKNHLEDWFAALAPPTVEDRSNLDTAILVVSCMRTARQLTPEDGSTDTVTAKDVKQLFSVANRSFMYSLVTNDKWDQAELEMYMRASFILEWIVGISDEELIYAC